MAAGGAQALLKSSGLVPEGPTVLAGCGPLLWLLAAQYLEAGAAIDAVLDTTPGTGRRDARRHALAFAASPYFRKGLALVHAVRRRVPVIRNVVELQASGSGRVERVTYRTADRQGGELGVRTLLLHQGVVPHVNLALAAGVAHRWNAEQLCFVPALDAYGRSSAEGVLVAGDGAGIAGAEAAEVRGELASIAVAADLGVALPAEARRTFRRLARYQRGRRFLDARFKPGDTFRVPTDETLVCRCEEVRANDVAAAAALGCTGPNQLKAFLRCGMGPCQGRLCGLTVTELIARARGETAEAVGYYRIRPPIKPITVGELASLPKSDQAIAAVVR
jgi:hypothetical protein